MDIQSEENFELIVLPHEAGLRLDVFLSGKHPDLSRSQIKKVAEEGLVRVNHIHTRVGYRMKEGDVVCIQKRKPQ